jgi:hypothetical protein
MEDEKFLEELNKALFREQCRIWRCIEENE